MLTRRIALASAVLLLAGFAPRVLGQAADPATFDYAAYTGSLANGLVDVAALDLPPDFVRRIADRSLRSHFRREHRAVGADPAPVRAPPPTGAGNDLGFEIIQGQIPRETVEAWRALPAAAVPPLRGFRAPLLVRGRGAWPFEPPGGRLGPRYTAAAREVAARLAEEGLIRTTMAVMAAHDLPWRSGAGLDAHVLRSTGLPEDLLAFFRIDGRPAAEAIARWHAAGAPSAAIDDLAARATFAFVPTRPGFVAAADDGSEPVSGIRFQLPTRQYLRGPGDGSILDVFQQVVEHTDDERIWASIHRRGLVELGIRMSGWAIPAPTRITLVSSPLPLTQWAQDNAKTGLAPAADGRGMEMVTLIPRFASSNEQMTKFTRGDTIVFETLEGTTGRGVVSPLLFQGGNILVVVEPKTNRRLLLIGEGELHRNRALGLRPDDVRAALIAELGADACEIVPATMFHVDLELTVRRSGDDLIAFVGDDESASRIIAREGRSLAAAGAIDEATVRGLEPALDNEPPGRLAVTLANAVRPLRTTAGGLRPSDTLALVRSPLESPAANAARFLLAVDVLLAEAGVPSGAGGAAAEARYHESLRERQDERRRLAARLGQLGFRVVRVPNLGDEEAGINVLNAIQLPATSLVPVYGGFYGAVDEAAIGTLRATLGPSIEIIPVRTGAVQAMYGGLHCMASMYPVVPGEADR